MLEQIVRLMRKDFTKIVSRSDNATFFIADKDNARRKLFFDDYILDAYCHNASISRENIVYNARMKSAFLLLEFAIAPAHIDFEALTVGGNTTFVLVIDGDKIIDVISTATLIYANSIESHCSDRDRLEKAKAHSINLNNRIYDALLMNSSLDLDVAFNSLPFMKSAKKFENPDMGFLETYSNFYKVSTEETVKSVQRFLQENVRIPSLITTWNMVSDTEVQISATYNVHGARVITHRFSVIPIILALTVGFDIRIYFDENSIEIFSDNLAPMRELADRVLKRFGA